MNSNEIDIFNKTFDEFKQRYPSSKLDMIWDIDRWIITRNGKQMFTTKDYNLLYNLTRLCKVLEDELL